MAHLKQEYPDFLRDYAALKTHFDEHYQDHSPNEKGDRFAEFVQSLIPYTNFGRRFEKPELGQKSHDGGVDLIATNISNEVLLTQSKFSLKDKADFGTIISKFQDYYQKNYTTSVGSLFAFSGIELESTPKAFFQVVTLHDLSRIIKLFEQSELSSVGFYNQLVSNGQLEIVDGNAILQVLRTSYRRTHFLPSDFNLEFASEPIGWDGVFLGIVAGSQLKNLYSEYGDALFFENLRDFLASTEVNQEIVKTVKDAPQELLSRNNGIVIKASKVTQVDGQPTKLHLEQGSVVNGCQTTLSIVQNATQECYVSVKVVATSDEKAWDITRSANFQNQVRRFDLELAQFLRPQIVKKAATQAGLAVRGNLSASSIIGEISKEEVVYDELRSLFIGIFSQRPSNIFDTEYNQLISNLMNLFFVDDPEGTKLFNSLFTIFQAANKVSEKIKVGLKKRGDKASHDTYRRFFDDGKSAYRSFFTLVAASAVTNIDISVSYTNEPERYKLISNFLKEVVRLIENDPVSFDKYYRYTIQAMSASVKGRDKAEIQQYLWKYMRNTEFSIFVERVHQAADLAETLKDIA
jgi:hypothetical protein